MTKLGHSSISVNKCGFIIQPEKGWLGASPDGKAKDPVSDQPDGIIEVKRPYSKREVTPEEACQDRNFCCELVDLQIQLKLIHVYYHQVQLQLYVVCMYVCMLELTFIIGVTSAYTHARAFETVNLSDITWQDEYIPELESFYDEYMLPELVFEQYKPSNNIIMYSLYLYYESAAAIH